MNPYQMIEYDKMINRLRDAERIASRRGIDLDGEELSRLITDAMDFIEKQNEMIATLEKSIKK